MPGLYIGLMSGTSLDGVDAVLAELAAVPPRLVGHYHQVFPQELRRELLALNHSGSGELRRAALAANALAHSYAAAVRTLLATHSVIEPIAAIGCHGQTVRHQPGEGYTVQLVNGALLAELTGVTVVCDFRSRDIAAGGQGAPLAPAFHAAAFGRRDIHRAIVNIGGIANLTDLLPNGNVMGFDCGPGNLLLDAWAELHLKRPIDTDGIWSRSGRVIPELLEKLLGDEYFRRVPPKSTGRETFNLDWLSRHLDGSEAAADVQATLLALTARTIAQAVGKFCVDAREVYLCGGGARNRALVERLAQELAPRKVAVTDALGVAAEHVEALAFAWLAQRALDAAPSNLPAVTGARGPRVLGAIYRA